MSEVERPTIKFNRHDYKQIVPPRTLRNDERSALEFLLSHRFPGREELSIESNTAKVKAACSTCASIIFAVESNCAPFRGPSAPVTADTTDVDGMFLEVLILVKDGYLDEMQIWRGDLGPIMCFPDLSHADVFWHE